METISFTRLLNGIVPFSILLLNRPIQNAHFEKLWNNADIRLCADGGFQRFLARYENNRPYHQDYKLPDVIVGDLDSLSNKLRVLAKDKGILFYKDEDDSRNDFEKSLRYLYFNMEYKRDVVVYGGLGGRFDHTIANLAITCHWNNNRIWLVDDDSLITLLRPGNNEILMEGAVEGPHCGLFPLGSALARITTTGLVWNVKDELFTFPGRISTSNLISDYSPLGKQVATVTTTEPILWTVEFCKDDKSHPKSTASRSE